MAFLRNTWYVAAWSDEVPESGMLHRRLLGEDVLIMRDAERAPRALLNRCPIASPRCKRSPLKSRTNL
jgi:phenylpropionate dioxygenase-like ring-hydroxylating dioxygenase large terminal subunit